MSNANNGDSANEEEEKLRELLQQVKELSPDLAQKFVSKATECVKEDAFVELINTLKEAAQKTVVMSLGVTKKKIEEVRKAKKRNGEDIDEVSAANLVYTYEERGVYDVVEEFLVTYQEELQDQAEEMKSKRLEKKRERDQLVLQRKREREQSSAQKKKKRKSQTPPMPPTPPMNLARE